MLLEVKVGKRGNRSVFVSFIADTFPNKGGFFCKIFADDRGEFELDNFVIDKNNFNGVSSVEAKLRKAYTLAALRVPKMIY